MGYHKGVKNSQKVFSKGGLHLLPALPLHLGCLLVLQPEAAWASFRAGGGGGLLMHGRPLVEMGAPAGMRGRGEGWRWGGRPKSLALGSGLPTHLSRTTLTVLRPRAAAICMTACPTPLLDAFWMTQSPVEPGRDPSQARETCNRSSASCLGSYHGAREGSPQAQNDPGPGC